MGFRLNHTMSFPSLGDDGALLIAPPAPKAGAATSSSEACAGGAHCTAACSLGGYDVSDFDWSFDEFAPPAEAPGAQEQAEEAPQPSQPQPSQRRLGGAGGGRRTEGWRRALQAQLATGSSGSGSGSISTGGVAPRSLVVPVPADKKQYLPFPFCVTAKLPELPRAGYRYPAASASSRTPERARRQLKRKRSSAAAVETEEDAAGARRRRKGKGGEVVTC